MSDRGDLAQLEDVTRRLRELHAAADDEDRPRAALYLALAIADLIPCIPEDDPRRGELAAEALSRLDESADASSGAANARKALARYLPASQEQEPLRFGGDLNWDLDWEALRGPAEAARNLTATLPMIASMLPPQAPLRQALKDIAEVISAFDQGMWSPEHDAVLASAIDQVESGGLGAGLGLVLRMVAMMIRMQRCQSSMQEGRQLDWPSLAELDKLIADMESADDLAAGFGGPFQDVAGLHHLYIAGVIMMRLQADIHRRDVVRDRTWRDRMLQLLDLADDHLRQTPPAYAGPVQRMRGSLARVFAALSATNMPPATAPTPPPSPARPSPAPPAPPSPTPPAAQPPLSEAVQTTPGGDAAPPSWKLDGPFSQIASPEVLSAFRAMTGLSGDPIMTSVSRLTTVLEAVFARRWTAEADTELAALRQEAGRLNGQPESALPERAVVAAMLAMARVSQWHLLSVNPQPAERPSAIEVANVVAEVEAALELLSAAADQSPSVAIFTELQGPLHVEAAALLTDLGRPGGDRPDPELIARARGHMAQVPTEMLDQLPPVVRDVLLLQGKVADGSHTEPAETELLAGRFGELFETSGAALTAADAAVSRARKSQDADDIGAAVDELNKVAIALLPGSPQRAHLLISLAEMRVLLAVHSSVPLVLADAIDTAMEATRAARTPAEKKSAAQRLVVVFSLMTARGQREGPFEQAEELLRAALTGAGSGDWSLRVSATVGMGAAVGMRAAAADDQDLRHVAVALIEDAERMLPEADLASDWYGTARILYTWTAAHALRGPDPGLAAMALRILDRLESALARTTGRAAVDRGGDASAADDAISRELGALREGRTRLLVAARQPQEQSPAAEPASGFQPTLKSEDGDPPRSAREPEQARRLARRGLDKTAAALDRTGPDGRPRRPLAAAGRPEPTPLRDAMSDLHTALGDIFDDAGLRRDIDAAIGRCAAELYWADPAARTITTLREAVVHLNRALISGDNALPTTERADLLDILARCRHEVALKHDQHEERVSAHTEADRAARAAVRELARCVLLTADTGQALEVAARANEIVERSVGWYLTDGKNRAAVEVAEAGRGLVLASVVLVGRVEEVLRGAGQHDVADAWHQGSEAGRVGALRALWDTSVSAALLAGPTADEVSIALAATHFDAEVYLVPPARQDGDDPAESASPGYAVLVRPLLSTIEVLPLPGLAGQGSEPLNTYLAALDGALASFDRGAENTDGFRSGARGQAWTDALDGLGHWAYDRIMGPLIGHTRDWKLDHRPHLALIPLGILATVPYGTAWTENAASGGSRRYAIDDLVLTYAASARLLGEVSRRLRQPLGERVVLVSDPTGEFPMMRRAMSLLASHQYPNAEVYGLKTAPDGPATTDVLLGALPGGEQPGASVFQLATHAAMAPTPGLLARDGWLPLSGILEHARDRPPSAPGGLIITTACLTDSTRTHCDESLTLATAFLAAGATAVIGTRWPVDDDTAAALSLRLHYHLQLGKSPADALRCAQLDLLRPTPDIRKSLGPDLTAVEGSRLSHPASWAGYVHHGI